jgi:hypothetical protein
VKITKYTNRWKERLRQNDGYYNMSHF